MRKNKISHVNFYTLSSCKCCFSIGLLKNNIEWGSLFLKLDNAIKLVIRNVHWVQLIHIV